MSIADFHIHTTKSDGAYTPAEVLAVAREMKLKHIALCDHHTVAGYDEIRADATEAGINVVPAFETSASDRRNLHICGYGMKNLRGIEDKLAPFADDGTRILDVILRGLGKEGIKLPDEIRDMILKNPDTNLFWVAKQISKFGYLFNYDGGKKRAYNVVKKLETTTIKAAKKPTARAVIKMIKSHGGVAVLAHPKSIKQIQKAENGGYSKLNRADFERLFEGMVADGLDGVESLAPRHDTADIDYFTALSRNAGIFDIGGSDFHGIRRADGSVDNDGKHIGNPNVTPAHVERFFHEIEGAQIV